MTGQIRQNIILTGHKSGLGAEIYNLLSKSKHYIYGLDIAEGYDCSVREDVLKFIRHNEMAKVDAVINNAGINLLSPIANIKFADWNRVMAVNAYSFINTAQCFMPLMSAGSKIINIISNASRVPMTHSAVYNASKGAAHILTRQMARELTKTRGITVVGVSPNKMSGTGMSAKIDDEVCRLRGWTREQASYYQRQSLVTGRETRPEQIACLVDFLVTNDIDYLSGCVIEAGY